MLQNNQELLSDYVFRSIINHVGRLYSLPDLHTSTYSFPKFKLRQYKSALPFSEDNRVVLDQESNIMNILAIATSSASDMTAFMDTVVPLQVTRV